MAPAGRDLWGLHREGTGPHTPSPPNLVKEEVQDVIKQLFHGRARCESEADWHGLCGPQR